MTTLTMTSKERSIMKTIPVTHLDTIREALKNSGTKYRIVYRGPRSSSVGDTRPAMTRRGNCLKKFATHFTVYPRPI